MSTDKWRYTEECEGQPCAGDCDYCEVETDPVADEIAKLVHDVKVSSRLLKDPQAIANLRETDEMERCLLKELRKEQRQRNDERRRD